MFRAAQGNPFDEVVVKATDENLTQENWALIIMREDVAKKRMSATKSLRRRMDTRGKDAVAALIKRLAHRNANVQLYTLQLANALSQNCGIKIHKELASRSFTDALLRLAGDRVKTRILEYMTEWAEMFSSDPDLGIMEQAYSRLKSQNPSLQPPSKPYKREITEADRRKEEEELQMALAESIKDKKGNTTGSATRTGGGQAEVSSSLGGPSSLQGQNQAQSTTTPNLPSGGTTAATVSRVRALFDFQPSEADELQFRKGDIIAVLDSVYKDWWKGSLRGQIGIFPLNYVEKLQDPTSEEIEREAQIEVEVFGEMKNVEKLLSLLSTSSADLNVRDNEEITSLYQSTVAIRPKLIELIGKYSQKKDDFTQLNEKFIKARRDYEALLDASMSQSQAGYGRPPPGPSAMYNYGGGGGGPPPPPAGALQQDPQRYYQHGPSQNQDYHPPREGPAPFYMLPAGQQPPQSSQYSLQQQQQPFQQHQPDYAKPSSPIAYAHQNHPPPTSQTPQLQLQQQQQPTPHHQQPHQQHQSPVDLGRASIYSQKPQELATNTIEPPPQGLRPGESYSPAPHMGPGMQNANISSIDNEALYSHPGQQQQQPYQAYNQTPQQQHPSQPPHAPPGVPPPNTTSSPPPLQGQAYAGIHNADIPLPLQPTHPGSTAAGAGPSGGAGYQYQAYKPPASTGGDVSDYYR